MTDPAMQLMDLATGYWRAGALNAAVTLGLFDALGDLRNHASAAQLADRLDADDRYLQALCNALVGLGVLSKQGERFAVAQTYRPMLLPGGDRDMLDALRFNADLYPLWGRLPDAVKTGGPVVPETAHLGEDPQRTRRFVMGMHSRARALAPRIIDNVDLGDCRTLLDVGCGPGTFGRALAQRHRDLRLTLFDLPAVLAVARQLTAAGDLADRVDHVEGDYRTDPLPGAVDAALYCGALHQESPETAADLFRRVHDSLSPGGRLYVVDMMLETDRTAPPFSALFSITMMLTSGRARVFAADEAADLVRQAGFENVAAERNADSPYYTIRGDRPR